jgi:hypothetical protein
VEKPVDRIIVGHQTVSKAKTEMTEDIEDSDQESQQEDKKTNWHNEHDIDDENFFN